MVRVPRPKRPGLALSHVFRAGSGGFVSIRSRIAQNDEYRAVKKRSESDRRRKFFRSKILSDMYIHFMRNCLSNFSSASIIHCLRCISESFHAIE
jgi:hypothetical protein